MKNNIFSSFTNLYELNKTLRFELKPIGKTTDSIRTNQIFEKDKLIDGNYHKIKYYFDILHREFVKEALKDTILDYQDYYTELKNDSKSKNLSKIEEKLRKELVKFFDKRANEWKKIFLAHDIKLEQNGIDILFEKNNLKILKKIFQKQGNKISFINILTGELNIIEDDNLPDIEIKTITGEKKNLFESFEGFHTYFTNFNHSRKNFYTSEDKDTAIANRAINENLRHFCDNLKQFEEKKEEYKQILAKKEITLFELNFYNKCLIQDGIDNYNCIIGGIVFENGEKIQGINEKINLYNQKNKDKKLRQFKILYKQILSLKEQKIEAEIEKDEEVFIKMREFINLNKKKIAEAKKLFVDFIDNQEKYVIDEIYIKGTALNTISSKWFASWMTVGEKIMVGKSENKKFPDFISFGELKKQFDAKNNEVKVEDLFKTEYEAIYKNNPSHYQTFLQIWKNEFEKCLEEYKKYLSEVKETIEREKEFKMEYRKKQVEKIENYSDSTLGIYRMMKYFALEKGKKKIEDMPQDQNFYNIFNEYYYGEENFNLRFLQFYNGFRNYLSKKEFRTDKIKLNFENSTLLDGFDKNKESDNFGVILRKDKKYYLGLMQKKSNKIFDEKNMIAFKNGMGNGHYEKMFYKLMADPKKDFPKGCFSEKGIKVYKPPEEILKIYKNKTFKIDNSNFNFGDLHKLIDFFKKCIPNHPSWSLFDFQFSETKNYKNLNDFYKEVEKNSYKIWFEKVSEKYINEKIENGELYLFQIYNKDFAEKHEGKKNLHTIYWENLFTEENELNPIFKLNGQAEIFFRPLSLKKEIDTNRKAPQEIIKNKRYTEDKYFFHCPITLNFACHDERINDKVLKAISETDKIRLIGIDRGEKHLLYLSVIDLQGNIHQIKSLNTINVPNKNIPDDYHKLLDKKEKGRDEARKSWQNIENIKELKEGYISQVINEINKIIFDCFEKSEFPIIVFEDLNIGFKRERFKIEKQVYQKFELALAKKLNYLVSKIKENQRKALQLTPPIQNFQDIYRQTGIIFYIPASFTSAICPICGFRRRLTGFYFENKEKAKKMISENLIDLKYDGEKFNFTMKVANEDKRKTKKENPNELFANIKLSDKMKFHSSVERLINTRSKDNKKYETAPFNATKELKKLFGDQINQNNNLKKISLKEDFDLKQLIFIINTILKLRNSHTSANQDFIACPACGFHSENDLKKLDKRYLGNEKFEFNGDANGAYNIARKGILVVKKIKQFAEKEDIKKIRFEHLTTNMEEWDKFLAV